MTYLPKLDNNKKISKKLRMAIASASQKLDQKSKMLNN